MFGVIFEGWWVVLLWEAGASTRRFALRPRLVQDESVLFSHKVMRLTRAGAEELYEWQGELLQSPKVRVGASTIQGAGDGVFATRHIGKGETVTWVSADLESVGIEPYERDYYEWYDERGAYNDADRSRRSPLEHGVGHLINDGAKIDAVEWTGIGLMADGAGAVVRYVGDSLHRANVAMVPGESSYGPQRIVALHDIEEGDELFRFYGASYWLRPLEYTMQFMMNFARIELRLLAAFVESQVAGFAHALARPEDHIIEQVWRELPDFDGKDDWSMDNKWAAVRNLTAKGLVEQIALALRNHSRNLFDSCARRVDTMEAEYDELREIGEFDESELAPWHQEYHHKHYDGYGAWLWLQMPPETRLSYAKTLQVYEAPFFPASKLETGIVSGLQKNLQAFHHIDTAGFINMVVQYLDPPFNALHYQFCKDGIAARDGTKFSFGQDPEFPW